MRTPRGTATAALALLATALLTLPPAPASAGEPPQVRRWLGAEGGFEETACWGPGVDCPGFSVDYNFGGDIGTRSTCLEYLNTGEWCARTGNRLFLASVPGGTPGYAYLSTLGSNQGGVPGGTIAFAVRVHQLPLQPVVIFRHDGAPGRAVVLTLMPDGTLAVSTSGLVGATERPLTPGVWHELTITYGAEVGSELKLYVGNRVEVSGTLPLGGPTGDAHLGIVSPTATPFVIGLDDYVESPALDAPIRRAHIDYLMPLGESGNPAWEKLHPDPACKAAARNWQFVSEDQFVSVVQPGGGTNTCGVSGGTLTTTHAGTVDLYLTEGIPSRHVPSSGYLRDLTLYPEWDDTILGVRLRIRGRTEVPDIPAHLGYIGAGAVNDTFTFPGNDLTTTLWGPTHGRQPSGAAWTASAAGSVTLRLDAGPNEGAPRFINAVRLDYAWVAS